MGHSLVILSCNWVQGQMTPKRSTLRVKVTALRRTRQLLITDGAGNQVLTFCHLAGLDLSSDVTSSISLIYVPT